jgi:hypothetical protein
VFYCGSNDHESYNQEGSPVTDTWQLRGLVCRANVEVDRGHYVAIVCIADQWWVVDDNRLARCGGPVDAFESGRTPVLLLYDRITASKPVKDAADMATESDMSGKAVFLIRYSRDTDEQQPWRNRLLSQGRYKGQIRNGGYATLRFNGSPQIL